MSDPTPATFIELLTDPDAVLARLRSYGSVGQIESQTVVVTYDAVRKMLQDTRFEANFPAVLERFGVTSGAFYDFMSISPLNRSGEEHRAWRQLMMKTFTPRSVDRLRPYMHSQSQQLLATFIDRGECEFVEDFARQLPSLGLCELVGVPKEDRLRFCEWADVVGLGFSPMLIADRIGDVDAAMTSLLDYSRDLVRERRKAPQDDLVSRLAELTSEGEFDEDSMAATVAGLVFAGHETTKNQLGWMVILMSEAPAEWDRVAKEPQRARLVIEEVLRLRSAATVVGRTATEDIDVDGHTIPTGSDVLGSLWSANRDTAAFPAPSVIDPERNDQNPQVAFGQGIHHCLGAALARCELQEALAVLSAGIRCPRIEEGATFLPFVGITGPTRLPISFDKR